MSGSELEQICLKIYRKHQRALDLLFEYRPDLQAQLYDLICNMVESTPGVTRDYSTKRYIRFAADEIDVQMLRKGEGWTSSKRILLFEIKNFDDRVGVNLIIGPGPHEIREKLFELSKQKDNLFKPSQKLLGKSFQTIFQHSLLTKTDYETPDVEILQEKIEKRWETFLNKHLPQIVNRLKDQDWFDKNV